LPVGSISLYLPSGEMAKKPRFDQKAEVRKLARERVGQVKPSRPIEPKTSQKPKHKKRADEDRCP
jgi:hypothetical protein